MGDVDLKGKQDEGLARKQRDTEHDEVQGSHEVESRFDAQLAGWDPNVERFMTLKRDQTEG